MKRVGFLLLILFCSKIYAASNNEPLPYKYPSSRRITFRPDIMSKCMYSGLSRNPTTLKPDEWYSNHYRKKGSYTAECEFTHENFLKYLQISEFRSCDYETGKEDDLRDWVLSQNDNSIDPVVIFRKSFELNKGHIFNTLLTIHQLLRNEARWRSKRYYFYNSSVQDEAKFWNKFIDIRGDLSEREEEFEGDHQGSWYRIWGIALYRLSLESLQKDRCDDSSDPNFKNTFVSNVVGISAELIKYLFDAFGGYSAGADRPGKSRLNNMGSELGTELIRNSGKNVISEVERDDCKNKKYIFRHYEFSPHPPKPDKSGF